MYITLMHDVHLPSVDLNLLVALDALLQERHVTRAAARIGLSQSAMSHALGRLREVFADPLLVRSQEGMQPTERALLLAPLLAQVLVQVRSLLEPVPTWDPSTAQRAFVIGTTDYGELAIVRPLLVRLAKEAPGIDLRVKGAEGEGSYVHPLARGDLELVIAPLWAADAVEGMYHRKLFRERFVVVARKGNPHIGKRLTLARYLRAPHALVAPSGTAGGVIDDLLAQQKLARRVALRLPHFLAVPHLVAATDLLVTLAERVARVFAELLPLEIHPLPLAVEGFTLSQIWHARTHRDPAHEWLRQMVAEVAQEA